MRVYLNETKKDLIRSYQEKGLKASGKYEKGLKIKVEDTGSKLKGVIESEGHAWYMEKGRKPNKNQSRKTLIGFALWATDDTKPGGGFITQWLKDKGIVADNPFGIAYNIGAKGIQVPNKYNPGDVITEVITDEWFDELIKKLSNWHIMVVQSEVSKIFK
ncbi:MAG: hypothetical protein RBS96_06615 [Dehalococcoidales bacterium]|nr:hypothetical protein [Dehalococcoidales bacterium]